MYTSTVGVRACQSQVRVRRFDPRLVLAVAKGKPKNAARPTRRRARGRDTGHVTTHDARDRATMRDDDDDCDARGVIGRRTRQGIRRSRRPIERAKGAQAHGRSVERISRTRDANGFSGRIRRECEDIGID